MINLSFAAGIIVAGAATGYIDLMIDVNTGSQRISSFDVTFNITVSSLAYSTLKTKNPQTGSPKDSNYIFATDSNLIANRFNDLIAVSTDFCNNPYHIVTAGSPKRLARLDLTNVIVGGYVASHATGETFTVSLDLGSTDFYDDAANPVAFQLLADGMVTLGNPQTPPRLGHVAFGGRF